MLSQLRKRVQGDLHVAGPAVQRMDYHHVELALGRVVKELLKHWSLGDDVGVSAATFLTVDLQRFPATAPAQLVEKTLLRIQGVALHLLSRGHTVDTIAPFRFTLEKELVRR